MKPYYEDEYVTLYHGDCRAFLDSVPSDLIVTDPPYDVGKAEWDDCFPVDVIALCARESQAMAIQPGVWNLARMPHHIADQEYRWTLSAYLSNGMTRGAVGFGNWIPTMLYSRDNVSLWKQEGDARSFAVGTETKPDHPSPKPYRVMQWVVGRMPEAVVCDPMAGSGTTLVAAKNDQRRAVGIELHERYCEVAAERLSQGVLNLEAG